MTGFIAFRTRAIRTLAPTFIALCIARAMKPSVRVMSLIRQDGYDDRSFRS